MYTIILEWAPKSSGMETFTVASEKLYGKGEWKAGNSFPAAPVMAPSGMHLAIITKETGSMECGRDLGYISMLMETIMMGGGWMTTAAEREF